ncbi:MAG: glycosyltransferase [Lachnospiraceae bacterium]|nr:glycosyltransferase [Lachnospiraceae bacterium]
MKISVIVPAYQVEKDIERCLDSIINQTYKNLEILVIDDGSKDSSGDIADKYASVDSRVRVIHKKNEGLPQARKTGVENATGEYIGFVDADDWIEPDMYQCLMDNMVKNNSDIASIGFFMDYGTRSENVYFPLKSGEVLTPEQAISFIHKRSEVMTYAWNKLYKKEVFKEVDFPEGNIIGEDYSIVLQAILHSKIVSVCSGCKYHYIQAATTMSKGGFNKERIVSYNMYMSYRKKLVEQFPSLKKEIINYGMIEEMAIIVSMGKNKKYDQKLIRKIVGDIRKNLGNIIFCNYVGIVFKLSAVMTAINYRILIKMYKIRYSGS